MPKNAKQLAKEIDDQIKTLKASIARYEEISRVLKGTPAKKRKRKKMVNAPKEAKPHD